MKAKIQNLFIALSVLALPMLGHAQVNYMVSGNTAYVTDSPNASGNVVIANTYDGYPVTSIGDDAFESSGITSVIIPNSVTTIGFEAFAGCYSLTSVTIPDSVTSIGDGAFFKCYDLTSVTIPNSVTSIGDSAFLRCFSLTNITVNATNSYYASLDGVLFDKSLDTLVEFPVGLAGSYAIPNSVTSISGSAFGFCSGLTSVTIGNSVTSIGDSAFNECLGLTNITIPDSVTNIGEDAFYNCVGLTGVCFQGNSPTPNNDSSVFSGSNIGTVYYLPGTTGWGAFFDGLPTAPWFLPNPLILTHSAGFGGQPGGFGFTISWATNTSVVVEAATNLASPVWLPVCTNTLTGGTNYFSDPQWTNYPGRFYRITSASTSTPVFPGFTGNLDVDMYNAAVADGTANGGVPAVMLTQNGGPFRVTSVGTYSVEVCFHYSQCVFTIIVGTTSCSSTTLPNGSPAIQFGGPLECGSGPYGY